MLTTPTREHSFGAVYKGHSGNPWTVQINNAGSMATGVLTTGLTGGGIGDYSVVSDQCAGGSLGPGAHCLVALNATPAVGGAGADSIFRIMGAPGGTVDLALKVQALATPKLSSNPSMKNFGGWSLQPGTPALTPENFSVINSGGPTPSPPVVALTGADAASFKIVSNLCAAAPLPPVGNCTVGVAFTPTSPGAKQAQLSMSSLDTTLIAELKGIAFGKVTVSVTGTGTGRVTTDPPSLECPIACETELGTSTFTLIATADADSKVTSISGCAGAPTSCQITLDAPTKLITVVFDKKP
jgi:hypothetical protein